MLHLPKADTTQFTPRAVGKVDTEHVKLPNVFAHSGPVGLFGDDATIPLVKPTAQELHPPMPVTSHIATVKMEMPDIPKNLQKGLHAPATKMGFGRVRIEQHGKKNVPLAFRG